MGMVSAKYPTFLTPAGYAFSIWGMIFLGLAMYAIWQLLPAQQTKSLPDELAKPLTLASVATSVWVVLFSYELILPGAAVMLLILGCLVTAYGRVRRRVFAGTTSSLVSIPFSLYLGWISVATVINITIGLRQLGHQASEELGLALTLLLLLAIVALGLSVSRSFRDMVFPVVLSWALVAVWVAQLRENPVLGWSALAGAAVVAIGGVVLSRVGGRKKPWELRDKAAMVVEAQIAASRAMKVLQ